MWAYDVTATMADIVLLQIMDGFSDTAKFLLVYPFGCLACPWNC